jgi:hypothetical protein
VYKLYLVASIKITGTDAYAEIVKNCLGQGLEIIGFYRILYEVGYNGNLIGIVKFQFVLTDISQSRHTTYLPNRQIL